MSPRHSPLKPTATCCKSWAVLSSIYEMTQNDYHTKHPGNSRIVSLGLTGRKDHLFPDVRNKGRRHGRGRVSWFRTRSECMIMTARDAVDKTYKWKVNHCNRCNGARSNLVSSASAQRLAGAWEPRKLVGDVTKLETHSEGWRVLSRLCVMSVFCFFKGLALFWKPHPHNFLV